MKLSVIINTFNEGYKVKSTCDSFLAAGADEIVVYSDATTDGSCDDLPKKVKVIKGDAPVGCGKAKLAATSVATGDVLMWVDAHQSVERGDLRSYARNVATDERIVCPPLANIYYDEGKNPKRVETSDKDFYPNRTLMLPSNGHQYAFFKDEPNYGVGVGLCMSRQTYRKIGGWNNYTGRHGSQERGASLRAFMARIPVDLDESICLGHEFFGDKHPSRNGTTVHYKYNNLVHPANNLWHSYMTVLSKSGFDSVMAPWLESLEGLAVGKRAMSDAGAIRDREYFNRHCKRRTDDELFDFFSSMAAIQFAKDTGGATLEPAAVHFLKTHAVGRCLELGTGSGKGTESLLGGAMEVVSIDHISTYSNSARDKIKAPNVKFITAPVKTNGFYDLSVVEGRFDLIIIDGPPGTKARRYSVEECLPFLAYGGCILADDANRDIEGIKDSAQKFNLKMEMLPTRRGLAKITRQAAS